MRRNFPVQGGGLEPSQRQLLELPNSGDLHNPPNTDEVLYALGLLYNRGLGQSLTGQRHVYSMEAERSTHWRLPMSSRL